MDREDVHVLETGAIPFEDGSGFEVDIGIFANRFAEYSVVIGPEGERASFDVEKWPAVKAAIDRAVCAHQILLGTQDPQNKT